MSRQLDSASDAASSVGGASDAGSEAGKSEAGSQGGDHGTDLLKESKFSLKVCSKPLAISTSFPARMLMVILAEYVTLKLLICAGSRVRCSILTQKAPA